MQVINKIVVIDQVHAGTVPADNAFHDISWGTSGAVEFNLPDGGVISHQIKVDLRDLQIGDLVRLRATYRYANNTTYQQILSQQSVSVNPLDPLVVPHVFVVNSANENHNVPANTRIRFAVAIDPSGPNRTLTYGDFTRISVLELFKP